MLNRSAYSAGLGWVKNFWMIGRLDSLIVWKLENDAQKGPKLIPKAAKLVFGGLKMSPRGAKIAEKIPRGANEVQRGASLKILPNGPPNCPNCSPDGSHMAPKWVQKSFKILC